MRGTPRAALYFAVFGAMTKDRELAEKIADLVTATMGEIRPHLVQAALTGRRAENENLRHEDNFLSDYDLWMHHRYQELLAEVIPSFIYASEEHSPTRSATPSSPRSNSAEETVACPRRRLTGQDQRIVHPTA
ncbi:hypothetical protein [Promicromonospora panici]|uniref:hypothetical protein n=1 Tax=Promicromonospora panici TaxID=2219658 RepID=UPI001A933FDD|nr:hypothetical protein [Promicromonospora panici]